MIVFVFALATYLVPTSSAQLDKPERFFAVESLGASPRTEKIYASSDKRLPNGKSRSMAVIKSDLEKSKRDIKKTIELAEELQKNLEMACEFIVDISSVRKAEKIEQLGRKIKKRFIRLQ